MVGTVLRDPRAFLLPVVGCALLTAAALVGGCARAVNGRRARRRTGGRPARPIPVADLLIEPTRFPEQYPAAVLPSEGRRPRAARDRRCACRIRGDAARMCAAAQLAPSSAAVQGTDPTAAPASSSRSPGRRRRCAPGSISSPNARRSPARSAGDVSEVSEVTVDLPPRAAGGRRRQLRGRPDGDLGVFARTSDTGCVTLVALVDDVRVTASWQQQGASERRRTPRRWTACSPTRCSRCAADSALASHTQSRVHPQPPPPGPARPLPVGGAPHRQDMTTSHSDFQLNRPGALIAALPAVLGFVPEKSLVLVTIDRGEMGCVMRVDLSPELSDTVGHLAEVAAAARPDAAIAVVVDDEGAGCRLCNEEYRALATATLRDCLAGHGIELLDFHVVDTVGRGRTVALSWTAAGAPSTTPRRRRWRWRRCWTVAGCTPAATSSRRSSRSPTRPRARRWPA